MADRRLVTRELERLRTNHERLQTVLAEVRASEQAARKAYLDLADAACQSSTSVEDACAQARATRQERDALRAEVAALVGRLDEARALFRRAMWPGDEELLLRVASFGKPPPPPTPGAPA